MKIREANKKEYIIDSISHTNKIITLTTNLSDTIAKFDYIGNKIFGGIVNKNPSKDFENIDKYMELAKSLGFHELIIFPAFPVGRLEDCNVSFSEESFQFLQNKVNEYNQNIDYPGIYFYKGITSKRGIGCQGGKKYVYVSPYGELMHCDFYNESYGNIKDEKVQNILNRSYEKNKGFCTCKFTELLKKGK